MSTSTKPAPMEKPTPDAFRTLVRYCDALGTKVEPTVLSKATGVSYQVARRGVAAAKKEIGTDGDVAGTEAAASDAADTPRKTAAAKGGRKRKGGEQEQGDDDEVEPETETTKKRGRASKGGKKVVKLEEGVEDGDVNQEDEGGEAGVKPAPEKKRGRPGKVTKKVVKAEEIKREESEGGIRETIEGHSADE